MGYAVRRAIAWSLAAAAVLVFPSPATGAESHRENRHLDVVEIDCDLIGPLAERFGAAGGLTIHSSDALTFDLCGLSDGRAWLRVVGNLPYNISTPLLFRFLEQAGCIRDKHFMLQKAVVERIAADPGGKAYGRLSVMIQAFCRATDLFTIGPGAFTPARKVESAFLRLTPYRPLPHPVAYAGTLSRLVAQAFSQRRKTLRNNRYNP